MMCVEEHALIRNQLKSYSSDGKFGLKNLNLSFFFVPVHNLTESLIYVIINEITRINILNTKEQ